MKCVNCSNKAEHKHHIVPQSKGGVATVDLCEECHAKIHSGGVGSSYLTRLGLFRKQDAFFARLLFLIVQGTTNIKEIVSDFHDCGHGWVKEITIKGWINRMKKIHHSDIIECLNPIMQMNENRWDYYLEEWDLYCTLTGK